MLRDSSRAVESWPAILFDEETSNSHEYIRGFEMTTRVRVGCQRNVSDNQMSFRATFKARYH